MLQLDMSASQAINVTINDCNCRHIHFSTIRISIIKSIGLPISGIMDAFQGEC